MAWRSRPFPVGASGSSRIPIWGWLMVPMSSSRLVPIWNSRLPIQAWGSRLVLIWDNSPLVTWGSRLIPGGNRTARRDNFAVCNSKHFDVSVLQFGVL